MDQGETAGGDTAGGDTAEGGTAEAEAKPVLPGNHGQFGANNATEDYQELPDHPAANEPPAQGPHQTNAGERS